MTMILNVKVQPLSDVWSWKEWGEPTKIPINKKLLDKLSFGHVLRIYIGYSIVKSPTIILLLYLSWLNP